MKEIRSIISAYASIDLAVTRAALATVVRVEGSSYRRTGARMLVLDDGTYLGGISGGCLEGDALRKALKAISQDKPSIVTYDTTQDDDHQVGVGLGCNGIIDVLFTPLHADDPVNPVHLLQLVATTRVPAVLVTITGGEGAKDRLARTILYKNDEEFLHDFPLSDRAAAVLDDIRMALQNQRSATAAYTTQQGEVRLFIECLKPALRLLIFGSHYDMQPLARLATELGWEATAITNRAKAGKELFRQAEVVDRSLEATLPVDAFTAAILMNHDLATDGRQLQLLLPTSIPYIGLLGPRKRSLRLFESLQEPAAAADARIFAPAGLDIGALTPEEIALSITAEIQGFFAGREGRSLRLRAGSIHEHN